MKYTKKRLYYKNEDSESFSSKERYLKQFNTPPKKTTMLDKIKYHKSIIAIGVFSLFSFNLLLSVFLSVNSATGSWAKGLQPNNGVTLISQTNQEQLNSTEIFLKAIENLNQSQNYTITSEGEIKSYVTQKLNIKRTFNGKKHYTENITTGLKNIVTSVVYENNNVTVTRGNLVNNGVVWTDNKTNYTRQEFVDKFAISPDAVMPYHINSVTIINASKPEKLSDGNYKFSIQLHPKIATHAYAKNLQKLAKLKSVPEFNSVSLDVVVNDNKEFVNITTTENYDIKLFGINNNCKSNIKVFFDFKTQVKY